MVADGSLPPLPLLEQYSQFFRLLSEPARLLLLCHLRQGEMDVAALIEVTGFSQSHVSRQLSQLHRAGLVRCARNGSRSLWRSDSDLVEQLCVLVQTRLRQQLEEQRRNLQRA